MLLDFQVQSLGFGSWIQNLLRLVPVHRLRVGWLEGVPREETMLKGHLPRVMHHQEY